MSLGLAIGLFSTLENHAAACCRNRITHLLLTETPPDGTSFADVPAVVDRDPGRRGRNGRGHPVSVVNVASRP
jgi:hypothetical protein